MYEEFSEDFELEENEEFEYPELKSFFEDALITEVVSLVKSGKEATVYCVRAHERFGSELLAAKVYRSRQRRSFKNASDYQAGRMVLDKRGKHAYEQRLEAGRDIDEILWVSSEFDIMDKLYQLGSDVPKPFAVGHSALLMEYLGDEDEFAPQLKDVSLQPDKAETLFELLMLNIELWLSHNIVHGDLSPYNILYWKGAVKVIDFPQAFDARFNSKGYDMLERDIRNVYGYFSRFGVDADPIALTEDLWTRFTYMELAGGY